MTAAVAGGVLGSGSLPDSDESRAPVAEQPCSRSVLRERAGEAKRGDADAKDGSVVCFFQSAQKFKAMYATLGFSDKANLDDGNMWPNSFALKEMTAAEEARLGELVKKL
jgi:hypothetical protein